MGFGPDDLTGGVGPSSLALDPLAQVNVVSYLGLLFAV